MGCAGNRRRSEKSTGLDPKNSRCSADIPDLVAKNCHYVDVAEMRVAAGPQRVALSVAWVGLKYEACAT